MYDAILMRAIVFWQQGAFYPTPADTPTLTNTLNSYAIGTPLDSQASALHTDDSLSPSSLDSVGVADQSIKNDNYGSGQFSELHGQWSGELHRSMD
jgi:beta-amylase